MINLKITQTVEDGIIYKSGTTWPPTSLTVNTTLAVHYYGCMLSGGTYYIYRTYLRFDTSPLPAKAIIKSAKLWVKLQSKANADNFNVNFKF